MIVKRKVIAYITRGDELLVFREPDYPHVGLQVPGGTVEPGEGIQAALEREVLEETGLTQWRIAEFLGSKRVRTDYGRKEWHYFHLEITGEVPETWRHFEEHSGWEAGPIAFDFEWADLATGAPRLPRGQGAMIKRLINKLTRQKLDSRAE